MNEQEPKKSNPVTSDSYIIKMMQANRPAHVTAAKLGMTVAQVQNRWEELKKEATQIPENGVGILRDVQLTLVDQFSLLGQTMAILSAGISNTVSVEDLRSLIKAKPPEADLAQWLVKHLLILHAFTLPSPEKLVEEHRKQTRAN